MSATTPAHLLPGHHPAPGGGFHAGSSLIAAPASPAAAAAAAPRTGAEALLQAAVRAGADVCFANPGTTEMWMVAAMDAMWPAVRPVLCLHENVATGAADGYARIARRPALTLLHLGPGLANGLSNLHNARRARSPVVNLVGDMATWHRANDPILNSPLEQLAAAVSGEVVVAGRRGSAVGVVAGVAGEMAAALAAALEAPGSSASKATDPDSGDVKPVGGSVVTIVVPHDLSWEPPPPPLPPSVLPSPPSAAAASSAAATAAAAAAVEAFIRDCAAALLRLAPGSGGGGGAAAAAGAQVGGAALYLGGDALLASDGALLAAGQIAAATGAVLLCEGAFARVDRGSGLPALRRLPYFPQEAAAELGKYKCLVIVDARAPVANFGYKGAPGQLIRPSDDDPNTLWEFDPDSLAAADMDAAAVLRRLAVAVGPAASTVRPLVNCRGVFTPPRRPPLPPPGRLTAAGLCAVLAALQPEGAVVVDESLTSGSAYWEASQGCPPFVHLTLTGGAIGSGPPLALGAAMALAVAEEKTKGQGQGAAGGSGSSSAVPPGYRRRRVINLQADGSAMYSLQALWSQAREQLPVTTVICANSSYAILKVEAARQRLPGMGPATRALTDLSAPRLDWVALAAGMGLQGARVNTVEAFAAKLEAALMLPGPFLIQADL